MSRGVLLDAASLGGDIDLHPITATLEQWQLHPTTAPEQTAARLAGCAVAVTNKVVIDDALMAACPDLKLICVAATGTNNIDLDAAAKRGISVKNAVGYSTDSVAQHTFSLILRLANRAREYQAELSRWPQSPFFCQLDHSIGELAGKTLGIIGYGNTGRAVERIARAFGMKVFLGQRPGTDTCPAGRTPLPQLLEQSDVISLHCPLDHNTRNLIGRTELAQMKHSALLINCARGGIVDELALLEALEQKSIAGAALDVLGQEPPAADHPLLLAQRRLHNLILTPHIAWASVAARTRLVEIVAKHIRDSGL